MRILLVEDDKILGQTTKDALCKQGYTVDWLTDGESVRYALQQESFDLVLLDLGLPKILGLDLLKSIRSAGLTLPVIVITAREATEDKIEALNCGADDFLSEQLKPELFKKASEEVSYPISFRMQDGYDHSYFFISSFIGEHIEFHAEHLNAND